MAVRTCARSELGAVTEASSPAIATAIEKTVDSVDLRGGEYVNTSRL